MKINLSLRVLAVLFLEGVAARCNGAEFRLRVHLAMHPDDRYDRRARNEAIGFIRVRLYFALSLVLMALLLRWQFRPNDRNATAHVSDSVTTPSNRPISFESLRSNEFF